MVNTVMLQNIIIATEDSDLSKKIHSFLSGADAFIHTINDKRRLWQEIDKSPCDILFLSRSFLTKTGLRKISKLGESFQSLFIVVITEKKDPADTAMLMAAGCDAVLDISVSSELLREVIQAFLQKQRQLALSMIKIPRDLSRTSLDDFVSKSSAMQEFNQVVRKVAKSNSTVLILGETGVGKERLAEAIHEESLRCDEPFVVINCGALAETLLESELFGHEAGSFTGAIRARKGCFEMAHTGTLFLDEIGEMPTHLQIKLLRALDKRVIQRVGSEKAIPIDVRVIAATNRDIEVEVKEKRFRKDLYYRINVFVLTIPPLRERREDIPELVDSYIDYLSLRIGCKVSDIQNDALKILCEYDWPGNVRELINIIERAMLLCEGDAITFNELPAMLTGHYPLSPKPPLNDLSEMLPAIPNQWLNQTLKDARESLLQQFELNYLSNHLRLANGRIGETAKRAGIDARTLFEKMKQYGLRKEDFKTNR